MMTQQPLTNDADGLFAARDLLDRQIIDVEGEQVAKVDDVEIEVSEFGSAQLTVLLTGPAALGPRLPGRTGDWVVATWRRLRPDAAPEAGRISITYVKSVGNQIRLALQRAELTIEGFEYWSRDQVISRIPGADRKPAP